MIYFMYIKRIIYLATFMVLGVYIIAILLRCIIGPKITDRIICANMIGTKVIIMICIVSYMLKEEFLVDVAIMYALINFISMVVFSHSYAYIYRKEKANKEGIKTYDN